MIAFNGRGILLDIEGTTSSISFVYDEMFPYVRRELDGFLKTQWGKQDTVCALEQTARDLGHASLGEMLSQCGNMDGLCARIERLMDEDVKATGLKQLQGLIWEKGFASGELKSHLFEDVPQALALWNMAGLDVRIYSSGSIQAQKLFFGNTRQGDLLNLLRGHYDTTTGPKKEAQSYRTIASDFGLPPGEILFLSDVVAELDAAREAGMQTGLVMRPGNAPVPDGHGHETLTSFAEVRRALL